MVGNQSWTLVWNKLASLNVTEIAFYSLGMLHTDLSITLLSSDLYVLLFIPVHHKHDQCQHHLCVPGNHVMHVLKQFYAWTHVHWKSLVFGAIFISRATHVYCWGKKKLVYSSNFFLLIMFMRTVWGRLFFYLFTPPSFLLFFHCCCDTCSFPVVPKATVKNTNAVCTFHPRSLSLYLSLSLSAPPPPTQLMYVRVWRNLPWCPSS